MPSRHNKTALPRGPHQMSRDEVEASQRQRVKLAMVQEVGVRGYADTSVAHIIAAAGVSRATFYQFYTDKEACFLDAFDTARQTISLALLQALSANAPDAGKRSKTLPSAAQLEQALGAYLDALASHPAASRTFLVEGYAAGAAAIARRQQSIEELADLLARQFLPQAARSAPMRFALRLFLHGVSSMVSMLAGSGRLDELPQLKKPLVATTITLLAEGFPALEGG